MAFGRKNSGAHGHGLKYVGKYERPGKHAPTLLGLRSMPFAQRTLPRDSGCCSLRQQEGTKLSPLARLGVGEAGELQVLACHPY